MKVRNEQSHVDLISDEYKHNSPLVYSTGIPEADQRPTLRLRTHLNATASL